MKKFLFVFGIVALGVACTPKVVEILDTQEPVVVVDTPDPNALSASGIEGKQVYAKKCTMCHEAKVIDNYTEEQWSGILPNMIGKAKLDETKAMQVSEFVAWELKN